MIRRRSRLLTITALSAGALLALTVCGGSNFGGSAWEFDETTRQYFYHAFLKQQPDLNWRNPEVRAEMKRLASLWLARGVDGFRLDAARHITEKGPGEAQNDQRDTGFFPITAAPHWVEFDWRQASAPAASDGELHLWIDGNPLFSATDLANGTA